MLIVPVGKNQNIQVTFDVTGGGEGVIAYYIREIKIRLEKEYWKSKQDQVKEFKRIHYEIPHCSSLAFAETRSELIISVRLERLIGFYRLAFFQLTIEDQYNELMEVIRRICDEENGHVQLELILDVIY